MIIITGASRGIGSYLFNEFRLKGETVFGTYNSTTPNSEQLEYMAKVNIANSSNVKTWIDSIKHSFEKTVLINCAGITYNSFAHKADLESWSNVITTNLIGTFNVIREVLPVMREKGYGRIINMSSVVAQTFVPGTSAYAASKSGLWGLTKSIAAENAKKGITINNLNLGYFNLGMINDVPKEYQSKSKEKILAENFGEPENILSSVKYLINNDYINGTSIDVNGGLY